MNKHKKWLCSLSKTNKSLKQDKKQLVFARASLILTNYFLPLNEALAGTTCSNLKVLG